MKKASFSLAILVLIALTACGGGSDSNQTTETGGGNQSTINVTLNDIYYGDRNDNIDNPPTWMAQSGNTVTVQAQNNGVLEHNWAVVEANASLPDSVTDPTAIEDLILFDIGEVAGGESWNSVFTAPAPGEYTVICTVAGHYPAMQGKLVVEE